MTPQQIKDELIRLAELYKAEEAQRRVSMVEAARLSEAGNMPASPAMPTPLNEADTPGNLVGRPTPEVGHNDFVERVRRNARPGPIGPQPRVPAIMGRRG
jgi:hypothetical protein